MGSVAEILQQLLDYLQMLYDPRLLVLGALGIVGGLLSGLIGVGGGIFFVPALVYTMGWSIKTAVAVSLVIIIFSSLSGTLRNLRSETPVNRRAALIFSLTVSPAALIGVAISRASPEAVVTIVFAALLLALAYPTARGSSDFEEAEARIPTPLVLLAGVGIGALSGLVGVGGGVLMVPLMILGLAVPPKSAIATSLVVTLFTGIVGAGGYIATGFDEFGALPPLIVGSMLGAWAGVRLRDLTPDNALRKGFAVFMVIVAVRLLINLL